MTVVPIAAARSRENRQRTARVNRRLMARERRHARVGQHPTVALLDQQVQLRRFKNASLLRWGVGGGAVGVFDVRYDTALRPAAYAGGGAGDGDGHGLRCVRLELFCKGCDARNVRGGEVVVEVDGHGDGLGGLVGAVEDARIDQHAVLSHDGVALLDLHGQFFGAAARAENGKRRNGDERTIT